MKVGRLLKETRERKRFSQDNMAKSIFVSQQLYSNLESNKRNMNEDLVRSSVHNYDDAKYGYEISRKVAKDYITPVADSGNAIEWHRLALEENFVSTATEAVERFKKLSLIKPPKSTDETEKQQVAEGIKELLDVKISIISLLSCLEQEYDISIQKCMNSRIQSWRAKGWTR